MALPPDAPFDEANEDITVIGRDAGGAEKAVEEVLPAESLSVSDVSFEVLVASQILEITPKQLNAIAPISLAYIGDAVFELYVRSRLLLPSKRIRDYHQQVVSQVKAEQQSSYVDILHPYLNEAERNIVRRGRNATSGRSRRAKGADYQKATGLEALIGFLYLSDPARLMVLLKHLEIT